MSRARRGEIFRHLRTLFDAGTVAGLTDAQLLERFVAGPGEAAELAFAALVERHGPMVLRVCRRLLSDPHAAEDAFQATFLVLVRRAGSIRRRESVASWLHGVARRVASCARSAAARRWEHERRKAAATALLVEDRPDAGRDELGPALHQELGRLPAQFREVAVLCLLEGRTQEEAAARLSCPVGTVKSRLATARQRLRRRLERRGLAPTAGLFAAALAAEAEAAAVPPPVNLVEATARAATRVAAGRAMAAGTIPAPVDALLKGALRAMLISKLKVAALAAGLLGAGALCTQYAPAQQAPDPGQAASEPDRLREVERKLDRVLEALGSTDRRAATPLTGTSAVEAPRPAEARAGGGTSRVETRPAPSMPRAPISWMAHSLKGGLGKEVAHDALFSRSPTAGR